ncbi:hypothetical protein [Methyloglobulus sp.]|uniref:hypothetical protein n=1 Tax=Methyloglobulus sp. TaxID=2518622 RepID=UPI0032B78079
MIIEKRGQIRNPKTAELDSFIKFNLNGSSDWEDEYDNDNENETIHPLIVLAFGLSIGLAAYAVGSYLFCGLF